MTEARYFKETPCEVCGGKPWESVFAFRSPSLAHTRPVGEPGTFPVELCPGSGGVRQEVTIDGILIVDEDGDWRIDTPDGRRGEENILHGDWMPNDGDRLEYGLVALVEEPIDR